MNLHEYQARDLLRKAGIPVPPGDVASTPAEVQERLKADIVKWSAVIDKAGIPKQ